LISKLCYSYCDRVDKHAPKMEYRIGIDLLLKRNKMIIGNGWDGISYSKRRHHNRCDYVCGGFTGLHRSARWSTWSPGRFPVPEADEEFLPAIIHAAGPYKKRPREAGGFYHFLMPGNRIAFTCCNCMLICHPDREVRKKGKNCW